MFIICVRNGTYSFRRDSFDVLGLRGENREHGFPGRRKRQVNLEDGLRTLALQKFKK